MVQSICTADIIGNVGKYKFKFMQVVKVWQAVGVFVEEQMKNRRAVRLLKFGVLGFGVSKKPIFVLTSYAANANCIRDESRHALGSEPVVNFNYGLLGKRVGLNREVVQTIVDKIFHTFGVYLRKGANTTLEMPGIGTFQCRNFRLRFKFYPQTVLYLNDVSLRKDGLATAHFTSKHPSERIRHVDLAVEGMGNNVYEQIQELDVPGMIEPFKTRLAERGTMVGTLELFKLVQWTTKDFTKNLTKQDIASFAKYFAVKTTLKELDHLYEYIENTSSGFSNGEALMNLFGKKVTPSRLHTISLAAKKLILDGGDVITAVAQSLKNVQGQQELSNATLISSMLQQCRKLVEPNDAHQVYKCLSQLIQDDQVFQKVVLPQQPDQPETSLQIPAAEPEIPLTLPTKNFMNLDTKNTVPDELLRQLKEILFNPPKSYDAMISKIGANRVVSNGDETMPVATFCRAIMILDKTLSFKKATELSTALADDITLAVNLKRLYNCLAEKFGTSGHSFNPANKVILKLKSKILAKGGTSGFNKIFSAAQSSAVSGVQQMNKYQIKDALFNFGVLINLNELDHIMSKFDTNRIGYIEIDKFLLALRGNMNSTRLHAVQKVYKQLSRHPFEHVKLVDLRAHYCPTSHGNPIEDSTVLKHEKINFMKHWDIQKDDVALDEFIAYYENLSLAFDGDDNFIHFLKHSWDLPKLYETKGNQNSPENTQKNKKAFIKNGAKYSQRTVPSSNLQEGAINAKGQLIPMERILRNNNAIKLQAIYRGHVGRKAVATEQRKLRAVAAYNYL